MCISKYSITTKTHFMKTITSFKIIFSIIAFAAFLLVLDSCKKIDTRQNISTDDAAAIAKIKQDVARQMEKVGGIPQIFPVNQKVETRWIDKNRNFVTREQILNNNFTSACDYYLPISCNLLQYSRVYRCAGSGAGGPGYFLQFEYELSWNTNIVPTDPYSNYTTGYIRVVSDATSSVVHTLDLDATNSTVQITEVGADPNNSGYYIFKVVFTTPNPVYDGYINGDINGTYTIKVGAQFVTDCNSGGDPYSLWIVPVTAFGYTSASGNDPCKRNEKAWFGWNAGGSYANRLTITGYDATSPPPSCGYGSTFVRPDLQQVQYSLDGGANWSDFINDVTAANNLGIYTTAYIRKDDIARSALLTQGVTYNVIIRFRNWKYVGTNPSGWPLPDPNTPNFDCFNNGDGSSTYSSYAYEYWPGVSW